METKKECPFCGAECKKEDKKCPKCKRIISEIKEVVGDEPKGRQLLQG